MTSMSSLKVLPGKANSAHVLAGFGGSRDSDATMG